MRIALVSPNMLYCPDMKLSEDPALDALLKPNANAFREYSPNDSLLVLGALTPPEHELVYMDDQYGSVDLDAVVNLAAITVVTQNSNRAYELAAAFRARGVYVVMGGIHVTMLPEEAAAHADTIVVGDADRVWGEFLSDLEQHRPKQRYEGGVVDIQQRPPPLISLLTPKHFFRRAFKTEVYTLRASSGCSRRCRFCSNRHIPGGAHLRHKTLAQIDKELAIIGGFSGPHLLNLTDDNLSLDPPFAAEVLARFRDSGFPWIGAGDVSVTKRPKLLKLLDESRCRWFCFGLESLDARNLRWLAPWKARQVPHYAEAIRIMRDHGINVMGSFIAGLKYDDVDVFQRCFDFFIESKMISMNVALLTPFPGTEARDRLEREGRLDTQAPWNTYTTYNLLFHHDRISKEQAMCEMIRQHQVLESPEIREHILSIVLPLSSVYR